MWAAGSEQGDLPNDPALAATTLSAARRDFGTVEEITDWSLPLPGSVRQLELRTQDPHGAFASSTLRLRPGGYPTADAQIALTTAMSQFLGTPVGADVTIGGAARRVVGLVENPAQLDDAFALVTTPEGGQQIQYTLLVRASAGRLAWRELGRNRSRSAAALATVTMAVGISVAAVVVTAANTHPAGAGNLSDRQVLIHATDTRDPRSSHAAPRARPPASTTPLPDSRPPCRAPKTSP